MDDVPRICLLCLHFAPALGGSERRTERQARQLQAMGHQVLIVTLRDERPWPADELRDGLPVVRIGGLYRRGGHMRIGRLAIWPAMLLVARALWRLRADYDVIHVMQISPLAAVAALVGSISRKPVILCLQSLRADPALEHSRNAPSGHPHDPAVRGSRRDESGGLEVLRRSVVGGPLLERYLLRAPVTYQALSLRGAAYLAEKGIPADSIIHLSGGVDTTHFRPAVISTEASPEGRRALNWDIVCVARFEHSKGVDILLRAWARLQVPAGVDDALPPAPQPRLLLLGEGRLQRQVEALIRELALQDAVELLGVREDVAGILQRCYAFVLPSRWEGMSNALLEAMACGLPCVATRVSGTEDLLVDGVNGLLVPPEQPAALSAALERLLGNPEEAARLGRAARVTIERKYSLPAVMERQVALYRRLVTREFHTPRPLSVRLGSQ